MRRWLRYLTCVLRGHQWTGDPDFNFRTCARCGEIGWQMP